MKSISLPMFRAISSGKVTLIDLLEVYFSRQAAPDLLLALHDRPIVWSSRQYLPAGAAPIQVNQSATENVSTLTISVPDIYDPIANALETLDLGGTPILVRQVNSGQSPSSSDSMLRYLGEISSVFIEGKSAVISCQPSTADPSGLNVVPKRRYAPECNYRFGDPDTCKVNVSEQLFEGTCDAGSDRFVFLDSAVTPAQAARIWTPSAILMTSGSLMGQSRPVAKVSTGRIELRKPFFSSPDISDSYRLMRRCLHTAEACRQFKNYDNFGGFNTVPKEPRNLRREIT